jgi:hypothetical protein
VSKKEIGGLSVVISANAKEFEKTVDSVSKQLKNLTSIAASPLAAIGRGVSAPGQILAQSLQPVSAAISKMPVLGDVFAPLATPSGFFKAFTEEAKELALTSRQASGLGLRTGQLIALQHAAGPAAESVVPGLRHLSRELGAVALGSTDAAKRFEQFGFNAQDLVRGGLPAALTAIAQRAGTLPGEFEANRLAADMFGRKIGQELLPLLEKLKEGLGGLEGAAIARGLVPTADQMNSLKTFLVAKKEAEEGIAGLKRQLLLATADRMAAIADSVNQDPRRFATALGVAGALGSAGGAVMGGTIGFAVGGPAGAAVGASGGSVAGGSLAAGIVGIFGPPDVSEKRRKQYLAAVERDLRDMEGKLEAMTRTHFAGVIESLQTLVNTFGLAAGAAAAYRASLEGANAVEQQRIKYLTEQIELQRKAKAAFEGGQTGLESFVKKSAELRDLHEKGLISAQTLARATLTNVEALARAYPAAQYSPLAPLEMGTQEERSYNLADKHRRDEDEKPLWKQLIELEQRARANDDRLDRRAQQVLGVLRDIFTDSLDGPGY